VERTLTSGITAERAIELVRALSTTASRISMATSSGVAVRRVLQAAAPLGLEFIIVAAVTGDGTALRPVATHGVDDDDVPLLPLDDSMPITAAVMSESVIELPRSRESKIARFPHVNATGRLPLDQEWICYPVSWGGRSRAAVAVSAGADGFTAESRFVLDILATEVGRVMERCAGEPGVGHWEWNTRSGELLCCDQTRGIHGFSADEPEPTFESYLQYVHPDDRVGLWARLREALTPGIPGARFECELRIVRRDGEVRRVQSHGELIRGSQGDPTFIGTYLDVTEQRLLEEKLRARQQMEALGLLAGGIAHDFNNLLVGILGNASLAHAELDADSPIAPMLRDIEHSAQRAADLTRQLLAYAGKGRLIVRPVDLAQLVHEMRALLGTAISKRAHLDIAAEFDHAWVRADATQLRQIIINLITNASDALGNDDGRITLSACVCDLKAPELVAGHGQSSLPPGRYAVLRVSDTGRGMSPETQARIFDPFFTTKDTGHGLGLSATLGIIRGHGGIIQVESSPGRGCTMRVVLPLVTPPGQAEALSGSSTSLGEGGTALLVDDDDAVRNVARRALERAGFVVSEAVNGADGVQKFEELGGDVTLVLLDLTMPVMNGEEAMALMRERRPDVPVLLSSGYNEQEITSRLADSRTVGFIQKPYTVRDLVAAVRSLLEAR
jgi:PAS domain S-box-containing protein